MFQFTKFNSPAEIHLYMLKFTEHQYDSINVDRSMTPQWNGTQLLIIYLVLIKCHDLPIDVLFAIDAYTSNI